MPDNLNTKANVILVTGFSLSQPGALVKVSTNLFYHTSDQFVKACTISSVLVSNGIYYVNLVPESVVL